MLCAGLPAQGPPRFGLGPRPGDPRLVLLGQVLQLAWHTQASCLLLEGPIDLAQQSQFQCLLRDFAAKADLQLHQIDLDLADQWVSSRARWWAVLLPRGLPILQLQRWPALSPPLSVHDVIPEWPVWPAVDEADLKWSVQEVDAYNDPTLGSDSRVLAASGQAPVALHSWGNALRPCPCGCRSKPFSIEGLRAQGLKGIGVPSQNHTGMRFLHPQEAGFLNSLPPSIVYTVPPRAALCLVGQLTAPLQAVWVYATVLQTVAPCFGGTVTDPATELSRFKSQLLQQRQDHWLLPSMLSGGTLSLRDAAGLRTEAASGPVTVQQLICAETALLPPGFKLKVLLQGRTLPKSAKLAFAPHGPVYQLQVQRKTAASDHCCLPVTVAPAGSSGSTSYSAGLLPAHPPALPVPDCPAPLSHPLEALRTATATDFAMWYGIHLWTGSSFASHGFRLVPPCAAETLLQLLGEDFSLAPNAAPILPQGPSVLIPFASEGHWALLVLISGPAGVEATLWDGVPGRCASVARQLARIFCHLDQAALLSFNEAHHWLQQEPGTCGAYVIAHAAALVLGNPDPTVLVWAADFLVKFPPHLSGLCGQGGLSTEQDKELQVLLASKGVPQDEVANRVQAAVAKVGAGPIGLALQQRNPWQALKTCASKPHCMFKWVHSDELQTHVERRAQAKFGTEIPKARAKKSKVAKRPIQAPLHIDPAQLRLSPGSFTATSGAPLGQLSFDEVQAQATGICFCSVEQALPFAAHGRNLSVDPLVLVTTAEIPEEQAGKARLTPVRYPAIFTPTQEAVLVTGTLVQLGDDSVQLASADIAEIEHLDTMVCKLCLYKDETTLSWEKLTAAPIRHLLQQLPALQVCRDPACNQTCPAFHAAVDEVVEQLFLDIWSRQWCRMNGSRAQAKDADFFQAYIRVPASAIQHLFRASGCGLYFEPRAADGSGPHVAWSVVWLPGQSSTQAQHALRTTEKAIALARLGCKYGLRTKEADEQVVFEALRPQHQFMKIRVQAHYRLHPLPHGLQRPALVQLLKQWGWSCKPLQPDRGDSVGAAWLVGAAEDPPAPALSLGSDFVLATKVRDVGGAARSQLQSVYASARTKKAILLDDDPDLCPDPWAGGHDPWSTAKSATATSQQAATSSSVAVTKLSQIQADLKQDLHDIVRKELDEHQATGPPPGLSEHDQRLHQLEVGLTELRHQNTKFEGWFQNFGTKVADQAQQLEGLTSTVAEQRRELAQVKTEVKASIQTAVLGMQNEISTQMSAQLAGQMEQIQALFAKKSGPLLHFCLRFAVLFFAAFGTLADAARGLSPSTSELPCDRVRQALPDNLYFGPAAFRFGEAAHPGPADLFHISVSNPSGLRNKESLYSDWGEGVHCFAETQLSAVTLPGSKAQFRMLAKSMGRQARTVAGAPAPLRTNSQWAGSWTGVLQVSDFPCTHFQLPWPSGLYETGRLVLATHYRCQVPLTIATVYGYAPGNTWPKAKADTDCMLSFLTRELVLGSRGFRVICGDFNHAFDGLDQCAIWRHHGWIELQCLAERLWGTQPKPTCKAATRHDYIWLSPEAAACLVQASVLDVFQEHSTLIAGFALPGPTVSEHTWPLPSEIQWKHVNVDAWHRMGDHAPVASPSSTQWFAGFSHAVERSLCGFVPDMHGNHIPTACFGRAKRLQPQTGRPVCKIPKPSRPGEEIRQHDGLCAEVTRWFQQLRRLQSLVHALRAGSTAPSALEYRSSLWSSICAARGFRGGFLQWWPTRPHRLVGCPALLSRMIPDLHAARCIFEDFRCNFRSLESWHLQNRSKILQSKYDASMTQLFHELRDPAPDQVDTLTVSREYAILALSPSGDQLHLDSSLDLRGVSTWTVDGTSVDLTSDGDDVCTLSTAIDGVPERLEQTQVLSAVSDLHHEFKSLWASRWQKHATHSASHWQRFLDFAAAFLPRSSISLPAITSDAWIRAVRRFKPRAARGPDGWAKQDLLQMPSARIDQLIAFLTELEADSRPWPLQMITGFVCLLCKNNGRADVHGFRPICLYSIIYRTWAGLRSRQILRSLRSQLPDELHGFVPGREATTVWYSIQAEIELAIQGDAPLLGLSTDIVKCFNNLPRLPLLAVAARAGVPTSVLNPWAAFLQNTERRFLIRGQVSMPIQSSSGFPEGCPLSPLAMLLADLAYHVYMRALAPQVRALSYVDNLANLAATPAGLATGYHATHCFMDLLDLELDQPKTYAWATKPADRRVLKALGPTVLEHARELGGFLTFGPRTRNAALVDRCDALAPLWSALRRSRAPIHLKIRALPNKCWSQALHGISGCSLATDRLSQLRAQATGALRLRPGGVSSLLRLSIAQPMTADPGFFQLWTCVCDVRRMAQKINGFVCLWRSFMTFFDGRQLPGPFTKLLHVLSQIGWSIQRPPLVVDHDGLVHSLLVAPKALLRNRLEHGWLRYVAHEHRHRHTMQDLTGIEPSLLHADDHSLTPVDAARLASLRAGAFIFGQQQAKFDLTQTGFCDHCQVPDDAHHQVCDCPRFAHIRRPYQWVCERWSALSMCFTHHLLPPLNPHMPLLRSLLHNLPDASGIFFSAGVGVGWQHLFTDGSCIDPGCSELALASWGVIHAASAMPIACGHVPGLLQTAPRAEIWAVIAAARWALRHRLPCMVWSDCKHVVDSVAELQDGSLLDHCADDDLWSTLAELLHQLDISHFLVRHVPSHLDPGLTEDPFEDWVAVNNNHADTLAVVTNNSRPAEFASAYQAAVDFHRTTLEEQRALTAIYLGIAAATDKRQSRNSLEEDMQEAAVPTQLRPVHRRCDLEEVLPIGWREFVLQMSSDLPSDFIVNVCQALFVQDAQAAHAYTISWLELVFLFHVLGGIDYPVPGPHGGWISSTTVAFLPAPPTVAGVPLDSLCLRVSLMGLGHPAKFLAKDLGLEHEPAEASAHAVGSTNEKHANCRRDSEAEQEAAIQRIQAAQHGVAIRRAAEAQDQESVVSEEEQRRVWAATKIQSVHRGRTCRQQLPTNNGIAVAAAVDQEEESAIRRIQAAQRAWASRQQVIAEQDLWAEAHHQELAPEKSSDSSRDVAALKIQALQRGCSCRQQLAAERLVEENRAAAALRIQSLQRGHACRQQLAAERAVEESRAAAVLKIQSLQRGCACRRQLAAERALQESRAAAALKIQSLQRGRSCRRQAGDLREERAEQRRELAAAKIQALQRGRLCRLQIVEQKKQAAKAKAKAAAKAKPFAPAPSSSKKSQTGRLASPPPTKALPARRSGSRQRTPTKAKTPSFGKNPRSAPSPAAPRAKAKASPSTPRSPQQALSEPRAAPVKEPKRLLGCQQLA
ncbi:DHX57, partial [Symbiodinium microadriaticum]